MKKIVLFLGLGLVLGFTQVASAQKKGSPKVKPLTEGIIIYDLKLDGGEDLGMMAAMIPTELTVRFKGSKSRSEFATGMSETIAISDSKDNKSAVVLLDVMGNKYAMKVDEAKVNEQRSKMPIYDVMETKETKVIAGYNCIKAVMINQTTKEEVVVYFTPEIPYAENSFNAEFSKLRGMPMEYIAKMSNFKITATVREVKKDKVEDSVFIAPAEYKVVTQEELMKQFGGGED